MRLKTAMNNNKLIIPLEHKKPNLNVNPFN